MFVSAGNPVLSVPNGDELEAALGELDLSVAIDLYVTDTARHCDFVLPATTMYEREDFPLPFLALFTTPFIQMTEAVVEPRGEARQEWEVIEEISERIGVVPSSVLAAAPARPGRDQALAAAAGRPAAPHRAQGRPASACAAAASASRSWRENPHGIVLAEHLAPGVLAQADPPRREAGPARPAGDRRGRRAGWPHATATTPTSRCG